VNNDDANPLGVPGLVALDPWLAPYADRLRERAGRYQAARDAIETHGGLLGPISEGHRLFGFNRGDGGIWYREWAPGAQGLFLTGDFNSWDRQSHPLTQGEFGVWSLFVPDDGAQPLAHGGRVKVHVVPAQGEHAALDRIPAYARRVVQEPAFSGDFAAQVWLPDAPWTWSHPNPVLPAGEGPRIYEAHVGMAREEERIGTYAEFAEHVLPRIAALGYNAVQLMAVQEHPYYASFGYHVSSFFAPSSRFGTPEDFKALVDRAHGLGLLVLLDLVHSHAVKNVREGLSGFDGTPYQYFHDGPRGHHLAWDSLLFDYGKYEVRRFLLSNVRYWLEEFRVDGFRFDGVTSMLYRDHGLARTFAGYEDYFGSNVDDDALTYLQLANDLAHVVKKDVLTIAEDVSGMPGLARPVTQTGVGFDYRLAMGTPDFWIRLLKEKRDEEWSLQEIWRVLLDRRFGEKHVGYVESHDQALVGDKTLAFQLMDAAMYEHMGRNGGSAVVERGVALHKIVRLLTFSLAGDAYLNFMGNEFGHPEWVDFPREGNGFSYLHARRQWSLADNPDLRYAGLQAFDAALQHLDPSFHLLSDPLIEQLALHEDTHQIVYRRGPLVFVVNLDPTRSVEGLRIPVPDAADYRVVLNTDDAAFAGLGRGAQAGFVYPRQPEGMYGRAQSLLVYLPSRSAQVLAPMNRESVA